MIIKGPTKIIISSGMQINVGEIEPPFDFTSFPGFVADYDADLGVIDSGGAVSDWADQGSNGYDLQQLSAGNQPTLITSDANFNNHNSISGDGTEHMDTPGGISTEFDGDDPDLQIYLVLRWNATTQAFKRAFGFYRSTSANPDWGYGTGFGDRTAMRKADDTGTNSTLAQIGNLIDTNPHLYTWRHEGTQYDMWEDQISVASSTFSAIGSATFNRIQVFSTESVAPSNIRFARIVIYNIAHSTADRTAIENELNTIYGL